MQSFCLILELLEKLWKYAVVMNSNIKNKFRQKISVERFGKILSNMLMGVSEFWRDFTSYVMIVWLKYSMINGKST